MYDFLESGGLPGDVFLLFLKAFGNVTNRVSSSVRGAHYFSHQTRRARSWSLGVPFGGTLLWHVKRWLLFDFEKTPSELTVSLHLYSRVARFLRQMEGMQIGSSTHILRVMVQRCVAQFIPSWECYQFNMIYSWFVSLDDWRCDVGARRRHR